MKSVLYGRTSTNNESQNSSIENQMVLNDDRFEIIYRGYERTSAFKQFMKRRELIYILDEYFTIKATEKNKIVNFNIDSYRKPQAKTLIISNLSRLSRDTKISLQILNALKIVGCNVYIQDIDKFSSDENNLLITILASIESDFSVSLSRKVKLGLSKSDTILLGRTKGYSRLEDKLVMNEDSELVRKVFDLALSGLGANMIANKVNIGKSSVLAILNRELYCGIYQGVENDRIEKIITVEEFEKVQQLLKIRTKNKSSSRTKDLARKINCCCCGDYYVRVLKNKYRNKIEYKDLFYMCSNRRKNSSSCQSDAITQEEIQNFIQNEIDNQIRTLKFTFDNIEKNLIEQDYSKQLKEINNKLEKLQLSAIEFNFDKNTFAKLQSDLLNEKDILLDMIQEQNDKNQLLFKIKGLEKTYVDKLNYYTFLANNNKWQELYNYILSIDTYVQQQEDNTKTYLKDLKWIEFNELYDYLKKNEKPFSVINI